MRILALETDNEKIKARFLCEGEEHEVLTTYYHGASFFFASVQEIFMTIILFGVGIGAWYLGAPMGLTVGILFTIWFFFVFFSIFKAWIDWNFDFIFVTTDKIVIVDQTSIFHQKVNPIHIENIGSVTSETQFGDIFRFGIIQINLKEGEGGDKIVLKYVPRAKEVASKISDVVTRYQRRATYSGGVQHAPPVSV